MLREAWRNRLQRKAVEVKTEVEEEIKIGLRGDEQKQFEAVWKNVQPDDVANISYTSGTTADPKGIMLSHLNYTANVIQGNAVLDILETYKTLAVLHWDHSFAHTACLYAFMLKGASIGSVQTGRTPMETLRNVPVNIQEFKPDIIISDFSMPGFDWHSALLLTIEYLPQIPFIVVTGSTSEEIRNKCLEAGVTEFISKNAIQNLGPAILAALK